MTPGRRGSHPTGPAGMAENIRTRAVACNGAAFRKGIRHKTPVHFSHRMCAGAFGDKNFFKPNNRIFFIAMRRLVERTARISLPVAIVCLTRRPIPGVCR